MLLPVLREGWVSNVLFLAPICENRFSWKMIGSFLSYEHAFCKKLELGRFIQNNRGRLQRRHASLAS